MKTEPTRPPCDLRGIAAPEAVIARVAAALRAAGLYKRAKAFETRGKRRKLVGHRACYDGFVIGEYETRTEAELALDEYVYEGLRRGNGE
jgi:hypothetical protein